MILNVLFLYGLFTGSQHSGTGDEDFNANELDLSVSGSHRNHPNHSTVLSRSFANSKHHHLHAHLQLQQQQQQHNPHHHQQLQHHQQQSHQSQSLQQQQQDAGGDQSEKEPETDDEEGIDCKCVVCDQQCLDIDQ